MNLQFYLEKLFASEKFQSFVKENPSAYLCSGFFSIDREDKGNKIHIDYVIPETKKVFSFQLEGKVDVVPVEQIGENQKEGQIALDKIADNVDFDFGEIEKMIEEKMGKEGIKNKIQKILLSLQNADTLNGTSGKNILIGTVFISGLGIIKVKIDLAHHGRTPKDFGKKSLQGAKMHITEFEKKSFFDMMKIVRKK